MATFFAITGTMTATGPVAGTWLVQYPWRYILFVSPPLALIAFGLVLVGFVGTKDTDGGTNIAGVASVGGVGKANVADLRGVESSDRTIDWTGVAIAVVAMVLLTLPLKKGSDVGWSDPRILVGFGGSLVFFLCFLLLERRIAQLVIDVRAFANKAFILSTLATLVASAVSVPFMYFVSVYGQPSLGLNVGQASGLILAFFVGFLVVPQFGTRFFDKRGVAAVVLIGGAVAATSFILLRRRVGGLVSGLPAVGDLTWQLGCAGAGIGFMLSPAVIDMVNWVAESMYGETTSIS